MGIKNISILLLRSIKLHTWWNIRLHHKKWLWQCSWHCFVSAFLEEIQIIVISIFCFWKSEPQNIINLFIYFFFLSGFSITGQQGKGEGIYLTPLYHFHPLHRDSDISRAITAESSPLHIADSRTRTGNLWFPSASR